jgi:hypothetical protein
MTPLEQASAEIVLLHEQIEAWFRGDAASDAMDALIGCFVDTFQMVTVRGERLDRPGVHDLFARLHGARPGIRIAIDQVAVVVNQADGWLVTYRETQVLNDGSSNRRHSIAWLQPDPHGRARWCYLQETTIS